MNTSRFIDQLILFDAFRNDGLAGRVTSVTYDTLDTEIEGAILDVYFAAQRSLIEDVGHGEISGNYLQNHFCKVLAGEDNAFTRMAESGVFDALAPGMTTQEAESLLGKTANATFQLASREMKTIRNIYNFNFGKVTGAIDSRNVAAFPALDNPKKGISRREELHRAIMQKNHFDAAVLLARYYRRHGSGVFEASPAFRYETGEFIPLRSIDSISFDDLVGQELQQRTLIDNTEMLLSGLPANNVLLYGDSGTGKSSSVKALLNRYSANGLKMISIERGQIAELPRILDIIGTRGMKFIVFIDDLSFEENESDYKAFKSVMEGSLVVKPANVIFIATSNRRNIVKEVWSDRRGQDDIHLRDNMQEKRSLADRFGITLVYMSPEKREYLEIVKSLAARYGLDMPEDELESKALEWEIRHGGRSGRAARQFVEYTSGLMRLTVLKGQS